jgi:hypothetical protein
MTSAHVRDPLSDHLLTLRNAAFLSVEALCACPSAPTCAAAPTRPTWSLVPRPSPRDHGHPS